MPITTAGDRTDGARSARSASAGLRQGARRGAPRGSDRRGPSTRRRTTSTDTAGLAVGAYLPREDPRDALCGAAGLARGCASGRHPYAAAPSCSRWSRPLDRAAAGNIDTRLRKRGEGLDAVVLAACGLDRLGLAGRSGTGSIRTRFCLRQGRVRSRSGPQGGALIEVADDPETGGGSRPSAPALLPSAEAASRRWPRTTTGRPSGRSSPTRTASGSSAAPATIPAHSERSSHGSRHGRPDAP